MHVRVSWSGSKTMNETGQSAPNHAVRLWVYYFQKLNFDVLFKNLCCIYYLEFTLNPHLTVMLIQGRKFTIHPTIKSTLNSQF